MKKIAKFLAKFENAVTFEEIITERCLTPKMKDLIQYFQLKVYTCIFSHILYMFCIELNYRQFCHFILKKPRNCVFFVKIPSTKRP